MANEIHTYVITTANIWLLTGHEKWYWKDFSSVFPLKTAQAALACINLLGKLLHTTKLEWGVLVGMGNVSLDVKLENVFLNKFEPLSCHISSWCFIFSPWTTHIPAGSQFHSQLSLETMVSSGSFFLWACICGSLDGGPELLRLLRVVMQIPE